MATLQIRNRSYRILFCYGGKRHTFTVGRVTKREAENTAAQVDQLLLRIEQNLVTVPDDVDIVTFVKNGGSQPKKTNANAGTRVTFAQLRDAYLAAHAVGAMESNSLDTVKMHLRHFAATFGERFSMRQLNQEDLQRHIERRSKIKYRGRKLSAVTIKKEMATLRAVWNWGVHSGRINGRFPNHGLIYPKSDEKPPFMTWDELSRRIDRGGLTAEQIDAMWECLYLRTDEITELLAYVKENATQPWLYPMCCTAAHTGARRSELLRMEIDDVDLAANTILIREKKRAKGKRTTRRVSLSQFLKDVLEKWICQHVGGVNLFCQDTAVSRSRTRRTASTAITRDEAHDHFKRTLANSKWKVIRGYHTLRHSFISCLAAKGIDQRIIDEFVGHQTDEQRRRYRHLTPDVKRQALASVFG